MAIRDYAFRLPPLKLLTLFITIHSDPFPMQIPSRKWPYFQCQYPKECIVLGATKCMHISIMVSCGSVFCFTLNVLFFATLKISHTNKDMVHYLYSHDSPLSWPLLEFRRDQTVSQLRLCEVIQIMMVNILTLYIVSLTTLVTRTIVIVLVIMIAFPCSCVCPDRVNCKYYKTYIFRHTLVFKRPLMHEPLVAHQRRKYISFQIG